MLKEIIDNCKIKIVLTNNKNIIFFRYNPFNVLIFYAIFYYLIIFSLKMKNRIKRLWAISTLSRLFYTLQCYLAHKILPNFDKSSDYFLKKWDSFYFTNIMVSGYTAEHHIAFFPLLPLLGRYFSIFLGYKFGAFIFNLILFYANTFLLNEILNYFVSYKISKYSTYFFIFNPASIIMIAFYTETLFMFLFLLCVYGLLNKKKLMPVFMISLSCLCRSNGILFLILVLDNNIFTNFLYILVVCIPISVYQVYCLSKIFQSQYLNQVKSQSLDDLIGKKLHLKLFVPYSYVQQKYWNQGFLKFYTLNNLSNFLIGIPFVLFSFYIIYIGFNIKWKNNKLCQELIFILGIQTLMSVFFLHLNMYFRFISYNPVVYLIMGYLYKERKNKIIKLYMRFYLAFSVAYAVLFGAFYPPA